MSQMNSFILPHPPILIKEIGEGRERKAIKTITAYEKIASVIKQLEPETIVFITPHGTMFDDSIGVIDMPALQGNFENFGNWSLGFSEDFDQPFIRYLLENSGDIPIGLLNKDTAEDYGVELSLDWGVGVPLYFINKQWRDFKIVHITYGPILDNQLYQFGILIRETIQSLNRKAIVIASGDLSHTLSSEGPYEYHSDGHLFDQMVIKALSKQPLNLFEIPNELIKNAKECGLNSLKILLGCYDKQTIDTQIYSYEAPYGVGYLVGQFTNNGDTSLTGLEVIEEYQNKLNFARHQQEHAYVKLARKAIRHFFEAEDYLKFSTIDGEKSGVFVTLHLDNQLRGCIGTIEPSYENVAEEIIHNAVSAAFNDPRFYPLTLNELDSVSIHVDVLSRAELTTKSELDIVRYGIIVEYYGRRGVLLPNLEGIDSIDQQITIALKKAGINRLVPYKLYRFEVIRYC